jgi:multidrug efflux pump subunit AcrA (membrane-fusion protein)
VLCVPSIALCEDVTLTTPISDAKKIVVNLEKSNLYQKQVVLLEKANAQLLKQNQMLGEQIILLNEQIVVQKEQLALTTKQLETQKELYEDKLKVCEKDKPSFLDKAMIGIGGAGIGALIALAIVVAL